MYKFVSFHNRKLEEKCAVLESKLFQLETQRMEKENESQSDTSLEEKQNLVNRMVRNLKSKLGTSFHNLMKPFVDRMGVWLM